MQRHHALVGNCVVALAACANSHLSLRFAIHVLRLTWMNNAAQVSWSHSTTAAKERKFATKAVTIDSKNRSYLMPVQCTIRLATFFALVMHLWSELSECFAGNVEGIVVGGTVEASMSVNLDPNGDGFGGQDHAVMLAGGSQFKIEFGDQVKFSIPGESEAVLYWHHDGKGGFKGYLGYSRSVTLSEFMADLAETSKAGELLHNVLGKIDLQTDVGVQAQVRKLLFALFIPLLWLALHSLRGVARSYLPFGVNLEFQFFSFSHS